MITVISSLVNIPQVIDTHALQGRHVVIPLRINIQIADNELRLCLGNSLRHTNATLLISEGADIKTVSALLGHSETSTTLNIYTHTVQKAKAAAAESLSAMLLNPQEGDSDAEKSEIFGE